MTNVRFCVCGLLMFLLWQTESESAADTREMVFIDQSENIGRDSSSVIPCRPGGILAWTAEECH